MKVLAIGLMGVLYGVGALAQEPKERVLTTTSARTLSVAPFASTHAGQCDAAGNLYFQLVNGRERFDGSYVMRLSAESGTRTLYAIPPDLAVLHEAWVNFSVSPEGRVSILDEDGDGGITVLSYDSSGAVKSRARLDVPAQVEPGEAFVYNSGVIFLVGDYGGRTGLLLQGKEFAALFEPTGKRRSSLESEFALPADLRELKKRPTDRAGVLGSDGLVYFAEGARVLAVRDDGVVVRRTFLQRPTDAETIATIRYSNGLLSVELLGIEAGQELKTRLAVLDAETGEKVGDYMPADDQGNNPVCFSRRDGYTFFRVENGKVKLVTAAR